MSIKEIKIIAYSIKISILVTSVQRNENGKILVGDYCVPVKRNFRTSNQIPMRFKEKNAMHYYEDK